MTYKFVTREKLEEEVLPILREWYEREKTSGFAVGVIQQLLAERDAETERANKAEASAAAYREVAIENTKNHLSGYADAEAARILEGKK